MRRLTRDDILGAPDLAFEDVEVPEWDGIVRVRELTARERDLFEATVLDDKTPRAEKFDNLRARLLSWSLSDENNERLFTEEDAIALGQKSSSVMTRLFNIARRVSKLSEGDVEELAGN